MKHGLSNHPMYRTWVNMMSRCYDEKNPWYSRYGARGIAVCDNWKDLKKFIEWADTKHRPKGFTIDRKDNDKGYEPGNCRFVSQKVQQRNRSGLRKITFEGRSLCVSEWAESLGVEPEAFRKLLYAKGFKYSVEFYRSGAKRNPLKYSKEIYATIIKMSKDGMTQVEIAKVTGVSQPHVSRILRFKLLRDNG